MDRQRSQGCPVSGDRHRSVTLPELPTPGPQPKCGRLNSRKRQCQRPRMAAPWPNPANWISQSCKIHASLDELATWRRAREESEQWCAEYQQALPIRCWEWAVLDEHRHRAAMAVADPLSEAAQQIAWDLLADWQDDRCAVCGSRSGSVLDHDHETGLVRGWLCRRCNTKEGFASQAHQRVVRYRTRPPTAILGIRLVYYGWFSTPTTTEESLRDEAPLPQEASET